MMKLKTFSSLNLPSRKKTQSSIRQVSVLSRRNWIIGIVSILLSVLVVIIYFVSRTTSTDPLLIWESTLNCSCPHSENDVYVCLDSFQCQNKEDEEPCCYNRGGIFQCPKNYPFQCNHCDMQELPCCVETYDECYHEDSKGLKNCCPTQKKNSWGVSPDEIKDPTKYYIQGNVDSPEDPNEVYIGDRTNFSSQMIVYPMGTIKKSHPRMMFQAEKNLRKDFSGRYGKKGQLDIPLCTKKGDRPHSMLFPVHPSFLHDIPSAAPSATPNASSSVLRRLLSKRSSKRSLAPTCFGQAVVPNFIPGQVYYGEDHLVQYYAGDMPLILGCPHAGTQYKKSKRRKDKPFHTRNACKRQNTGSGDSNSREYALAVYNEIYRTTGHYPHLIINRLDRDNGDFNRQPPESNGESWCRNGGNKACDGHITKRVIRYFWDFILMARKAVSDHCGKGLYIDIHINAHSKSYEKWVELGTSCSSKTIATLLNYKDATISDPSKKWARNSQQNLVKTNTKGGKLADILRGPKSLGGLLEQRSHCKQKYTTRLLDYYHQCSGKGESTCKEDSKCDWSTEDIRVVPSTRFKDNGRGTMWNAGSNTLSFGSRYGGVIDSIQVETYHAYARPQSSANRYLANRPEYSKKFGSALLKYLEYWYDFTIPQGTIRPEWLCEGAVKLEPNSQGIIRVVDSTTGSINEFGTRSIHCDESSSNFKSYGLNGPNIYYQIHLESQQTYKFLIHSGMDYMGLYLFEKETCTESEINQSCHDSGFKGVERVNINQKRILTVTAQKTGWHTLAIDSAGETTKNYGWAEEGAYNGPFELIIMKEGACTDLDIYYEEDYLICWECRCEYPPGYHFKPEQSGGQKISKHQTNTVEECAALCTSNNQCVAFDYWHEHHGYMYDQNNYSPLDCILRSTVGIAGDGLKWDLNQYIKL